jgi:hypothetical protein
MVSAARDADLKYVDNTAPSPISVIALFETQPTLFCQQTRGTCSHRFLCFSLPQLAQIEHEHPPGPALARVIVD